MASYRNALAAIFQSVQSKGIFKTFKEVVTLDQAKVGALVGTDALGNEYYENRNDVANRDRWVIYNKWDYDATQVPPEWHQWLHKMTDDIPSDTTLPKPVFQGKMFENMTGTSGAFRTYDTTTEKLTGWAGEPRTRG